MTIDRWEAMRRHLAGQRVPRPPRLPGHRHRPLVRPGAPDKTAAEWEKLHGPWTPPPESPRYWWMERGIDDASA